VTPWGRIRRRWRRFKREREARKLSDSPLREFVYLDEVSVYSLIASRKGPIATDYRDTASTLLRSELEGRIGANAGVAKSQVSSRVESSQTSETQTVRKAVIQSTFRELYEAERSKLTLRADDLGRTPKQPRDLDELRSTIVDRVAGDGWVVAPEELTRGQLVEVEVELQADAVFRFSTTAAALLDMLQGNTELAGHVDPRATRQVADANRLLQRLLVGLVPLRGRAVAYRSVVVDDREWIVHEYLLRRVAHEVVARPLYVVGVAEQQLFWKDIRRVLFSQSRYLVLARLGKDGVQSRWSAVKLIEVLSDTVPDVARSIDEAIRSLPTMVAAAGDSSAEQEVSAGSERLQRALSAFGPALAQQHGHEYSGEEIAADVAERHAPAEDSELLDALRDGFGTIAADVADRFGIELDQQVVTEQRQQALQDVGLWPPTASTFSQSAELTSHSPGEAPTGDRCIDTEIVAVYW
jgi:hypothetical protein